MTATADPGIVVVPASLEMAGEIASLHRQTLDPAWDEASIRSMLQQPEVIACLARAGTPAIGVGFVIGRVVLDEAEILAIGTLATWRRHGVAARLLDELARLAVLRGAERLFLEVATDNDAARALYFNHGFAEAGIRRGYYERPGLAPVDAAILVKRLGR